MSTRAEIDAAPEEIHTPPERPRLRPLHWSELRGALPDRAYLIKRLLDADSESLLVGEPGSMKTFVTLDLSLHIALGRPWCGRRVKRGGVVYIAAEGGRSLADRLDAFVAHHNVERDRVPFYVVPTTVNLKDEKPDLNELVTEIGSLPDPPLLLIVDTLSRALAGGNENGPDDMGAFVANVRRLREALGGAHVLIVHHLGKDAARGARGHSLLRAAVDTEISVTKHADDELCVATVTKQRDYEIGAEFTFEWEEVPIGLDEDEEPVTSLVLVPTDRVPAATKGEKADGLPPQARTALDVLKGLTLEAADTPLTEVAPPAARAVPEKDWHKACDAVPLTKATGESAARAAFSRAKKELREGGFIGEADGGVWIAPDGPTA